MESDLSLKKKATGTSQHSNNSTQPKIVVHAPSNPLKRSTSFLRSSNHSRID